MRDSLDRLYRTKLVLAGVLLSSVGVVFLFVGQAVERAAGFEWLKYWPIADIGSGLFTTGLLGVALHYLDGRDSEVRTTARLRRVLADSTPAMRDAVIAGFALQPGDLARVATPQVLDQIVTNGLAIRLGDAVFAAEIYEDVREQAIGVPERLYDARADIRLSPLPMGSATPNRRGGLFVATIRWEFQLVPTYQTRRFVCLSDIDEFRELRQDTVATSAWYVGLRTGLDAGDRETFELLECSVDGEPRPIRRTTKKGGQTYSVNLGEEALRSTKPVTVAYTYKTLVSADEHLLQLRVDQPTRGLTVELDYGDTDLTHVNVLDFIASSELTRLSRSPVGVPGRSIMLEFDGWVFARSGVAFVW